MTEIKFGTDGWRAIIAKDYTVDNVARVAEATARWVVENFDSHSVVLGYDCRFGGKLFSETTIKVMADNGVKTYFAKEFVSTPMVSLGTKALSASCGIVITASHNPPTYNGFKLKSRFGGPEIPKSIAEVEALIPAQRDVPNLSLEEIEQKGLLEYVDLEQMYFDHAKAHLDLDAMINSPFKAAYDAMYGAGQRVFPRLIPNATLLHCEHNPGFDGQAPEPLHKNLQELSRTIAADDSIKLGIANDGDADRIGMYDASGNFVDSHRVILLLIHILRKYKEMDGKVVIAFSVSNKVKKLCDHYGLEYEVTKIGFKYICERMLEVDVLVGGEESGGIAVKGHIPERDGIWDGLVILEHMAKSGKTIEELLDEVYTIVGRFEYDRWDLHVSEADKARIIENCRNSDYSGFGDYIVERIEDIDGWKFYLGDDRTVMIRPSGTEPVLRVYGEAATMEEVQQILAATKETILSA